MASAAGDLVAEPIDDGDGSLLRGIGWQGAFWIAAGVPALVLFSIGSVGATVGKLGWIVWTISIVFGFLQAFSYAEIAGLYPNKSGGASVYGAMAWAPYSKILAPISVWCNWIAWSPVLAIGSGLAAGYILAILFGADAAINQWNLVLLDLSAIKPGLAIRLNATFLLGVTVLLIAFAIQHRGIHATARVQVILGVVALLPLIVIGLVPLLAGDVMSSNLLPLLPTVKDAAGRVGVGQWDAAAVTVFAGGLFIAAWSTYAFETAICYTREFRNPRTDTFKAIFYSGLLCLLVFTLVPLTFQGVLGVGQLVTSATDTAPAVYDGILAPDIYSNMGVGPALAAMVGAGPIVTNIIVVMLILALMLAIVTSMAGSSRTLYQASLDGWLPRYLGRANAAGAPTRAMWTDLAFNVALLTLSDYVFILAISNVCYIVFNFLNLNAAWLHRIDRPDAERPYRAPFWLLCAGTVLAFTNVAIMGLGADIWAPGTLWLGLLVVTAVVPVFAWRHYITDRGVFPRSMQIELEAGVAARRAGILPFATIALGLTVLGVAHGLAVYP